MIIGMPIRGEKIVLVDDCDVPLVSSLPWRAKRDGETFYAHSQIYVGYLQPFKKVLLHRLILNAGPGQVVDHINGDGLDNRRCNIRLCTVQENAAHRLRQRRGATGFRGIHETKQGYRARIYSDGRKREIGVYPTAEDAARAYDAECLRINGTFAVLNFPQHINP